MATSARELLQVRPGSEVNLADIDPRSTPGVNGKRAGRRGLGRLSKRLADLQERLYAEGTTGSTRRLLVVLQGMDTCGKDGTVKHVVGAMNPMGVDVTAFTAPTAAELRHDFLWRVRRRVPGPGQVGIFNRSHYEDVLIVRVHDLVPESEWSGRYELINAFEAELAGAGVTLVKVLLHISADEQRDRLLRRLRRPDKRWKFDPADLAERERWQDYRTAYEAALGRCSTPSAPWYVVPADRRWYRNWAVASLITEALEQLAPRFPETNLDIRELTRQLRRSSV